MLFGLTDEMSLNDVSVNLSCGEIGVSEYLLDGPQIGTAFEKMSRTRMPELMGRYVRQTRGRSQFLKKLVYPMA